MKRFFCFATSMRLDGYNSMLNCVTKALVIPFIFNLICLPVFSAEEDTFKILAFNSSKIKLNIRELKPERIDPKGHVIIVHGIQESGQRYLGFAQDLVKQSFGVWILDLRGHGNSGGRRVYVDSFEQYVDDLDMVVDEAKRRYPNQKLFIFAHSMGGLIAFRYETEKALGRKIDGYILSSPALKIRMSTGNSIKNSLATLPWLKERLKEVEIAPGIDYTSLVTDPQILEILIQSSENGAPLIYPNITIRLGTELYAATLDTQDLAPRFQSPVVMLSTVQDQIIDPERTRAVFSLVPALYNRGRFDHDEAQHEIINSEPKVRNKAIYEVLNFLEALMAP